VTKIRGGFMKKLFITVMLFSLTLSAFSQDTPLVDDPYAKFQGVWYGVIYDEDPVFFVFIDDIFICNLDYGFLGRYSVEDNDLIVTSGRELGVDGWEKEGVWGKEWEQDETFKIQYVFSGERLVLVFGGDPITLSKDYTDFPEW
jgi:hypothetical protein